MSKSMMLYNNSLEKPVIAVTEEDKDKIKLAIDKRGKESKEAKPHKSVLYIAERDKLLVEFLFNTGMRISDVLGNPYNIERKLKNGKVILTKPYVGLRYRDVVIQREAVTFIVHKRSRTKPFILTISLDKSILFEIQRFREMFMIDPNEELFKLTRQTFDDNLAKYCKIAGLPKYSAHKFRHGCAMRDLNAGVPDFVTSYRLGHSSTNVTNSIYRRMDVNIERNLRNREWK